MILCPLEKALLLRSYLSFGSTILSSAYLSRRRASFLWFWGLGHLSHCWQVTRSSWQKRPGWLFWKQRSYQTYLECSQLWQGFDLSRVGMLDTGLFHQIVVIFAEQEPFPPLAWKYRCQMRKGIGVADRFWLVVLFAWIVPFHSWRSGCCIRHLPWLHSYHLGPSHSKALQSSRP